MLRSSAAPFGLGATSDNATNCYDSLLGMKHAFPGVHSAEEIEARLVENDSTVVLSPDRSVVYKAGFLHKKVDGYSRLTDVKVAGVVDPTLASTVPVGHCFWLVTKGLVTFKTSLEGGAENNIAVDGLITSSTAAASTSTTGGRAAAAVHTGATEPLVKSAFNAIARAVSANTTGQTDRDLLVYVDVKDGG